MNLRNFLLATALGTSLALSGCSVEQTEEARLPEVEVETQAGQMPEYDVDTAEVDVTTEEKKVNVPEVEVVVEEKTVEVPKVDVDMPDDDKDAE